MQKTIYSREARVLSELLKELRTARSLTQSELAKMVRMKNNDISKMELGQRRVGYIELRHLLNALAIDAQTFEYMFDERSSLQLTVRKRRTP